MPLYRLSPLPALPGVRLFSLAMAAVRAVAFWAAIVLVLVYPVALLVPQTLPVEYVLALLVTHSMAVVLGHEHARRQD